MRSAAALVVVRLICPLTLILLVAGSSVASGALSQPGLVAAYSFDAGAGSMLADVSGRGNSGAIAGATWTAAGKSGGALSFDGDDDWVSIADAAALDLTYGMTMEAWVKPSALGGSWRTVLEKSRNSRVAYGLFASEETSRSAAQISVNNVRTARGPALPLGVWSHLAATYDGSTLRLYVNGTFAASANVNGDIHPSPDPLYIGGTPAGAEWFVGQIDEVRIYNRALSEYELRTDMSTPVDPDTQPPTNPGGLTISGATQTQIELGWNPSSDNVRTTGYHYFLNDNVAGSGTNTRYTYTGLACGTSYTLSVDAYDAAGNRSGRSSIIASTSACPDTVAPSAPTGLAVSSRTQTEITLTWSPSADNFGVTGYDRFRDGTRVSTGTETRYTYTGLSCGTSYTLAVAAFDGGGNESGRTSLTTATSACAVSDTTPPSVPQGLRATSASESEISIAWNATPDNVGVVGYRLYRNGSLVGSTASLSSTFSGLSCGTTYYLGVEAFDAADNRSYLPESILTAATSACGSTSPLPPVLPPTPGTANLWVDTNGGLCVRGIIATAYLDLSACGSLNAAYQAALPGDVILVTAGTYQDQIINSKPTAGSPGVVIQAAPDAAVTIKELKISASWLTLRNMTVMPVAGRTPSDKLIDIKPGPRYLTLDNVDLDGRIGGVRQLRDGLGISGDTDYVTVRNSDICCVQDSKLIQIQTYGTSIQNRHLTFSGNTIHDDWQTDSSKHLECLWLEGISDFLFEGNHLWDCALNAIIANADEGGTYANWTIINNVFESADAGVGGVPPDFDACASTHPKTNWYFAYNYFSRGLALTSCGGSLGWLTLRGNIGAAGDFECGSGAIWEYNTWAQRKCSTTDTQNSNITSASNYVAAKAVEATGPGNYRASSSTAPQVNTGHPTLWPATDADGTPRPVASRADSGPFENH